METRASVAETGDVVVGNSGSKRQKSSAGDEFGDRISSLPDSILVHILSFLTVRDAVATILIPRFSDLWTSIDSLDFDMCANHVCEDFDYDVDKFTNFVRHALVLHARPTICKFRLKFWFTLQLTCNTNELQENAIEDEDEDVSYIKEKRLANEIDTWLSFAVKREVNILDLDLAACGYGEPELSYKLPHSVLRSPFVTELKLVGIVFNPCRQVHMKSLKSLHLTEATIVDEMINGILSGCPTLEVLSLSNCHKWRELNITSQRLKRLVIVAGCFENSKLEITCPNVRSLYIFGWLERVDLGNVSCNAEAELKFSYRYKWARKEYHELHRLFEKLSKVKALKVCRWCMQVFSIRKLLNMPCSSFNWKCLVLKTYLVKWHLYGIISLLRNSAQLETLKLHVQAGIDLRCSENMWLDAYDFDEEGFWKSLQPFANQLKTVDISGFIIHPNVIQMVKFLLRNSTVLEKVVIHTEKDKEPQWMERLLEYSQKLSSFPRASSCAILSFI